MVKILRNSFFLALCIAFFSVQAQNLDSLITNLSGFNNTQKIEAYGEICQWLSYQNTDSAAYYGEKGVKLAEKSGEQRNMAEAYNSYSFAFLNSGKFEEALSLCKRSLALRRTLKDSSGIISSLSKVAMCQRELGNPKEALKSYAECVKLAKQFGQTANLSILYDNMGTLYLDLTLYEKAVEYHKKALELIKQDTTAPNYAIVTGNIGVAYVKMRKPEQALKYYKKCLPIFEQYNQLKTLGTIYLNLGSVYSDLKQPDQSLDYANKALEVYTKLGDVEGASIANHNISNHYLIQRDFRKAKKHAFTSLEQGLESGATNQIANGYKSLNQCYLAVGAIDSANYFRTKEDSLRAQVLEKNLAESLAETQVKYETAEKEAQILKQEADLAKADLAVKTRTNWILGLGVLILIIAFVGFTVYRNQKQKQERLQAEAKLQEEVAKAEMRARVQEERVRISRDLHDHIGAQLTVITSSIDNMAFREGDEVKKKRFDAISDQTRDTIAQLRETIWAMNNESIEVEMLVSKLREYTGKINALEESSDARIEVLATSERYSKLGPAQTIALFRVCQEAINNALKYAHFKHLQVSFSKTIDGKDLRVKISDDGNGFDVEEALARGYGLANMQQRITDVQGYIRFESKLEKGTTIIIEIPVHTASHKI